MAAKRVRAGAKRRQSVPGEIIDILLNSPVGESLDEKLRLAIGLPPREAPAKIKAEAKGTAEKIKSDMGRNSPYKVLGVDPAAPEEVIRAAYKARARKAHPDAGGSNKKMAEINEAYQQILKMRGWKT
jgi:hypothetical protein